MSRTSSQYLLPLNEQEDILKVTNSILKRDSNHRYRKKNFYVAYLNSRDIIHTPLEIESSIPEDSIEDYIYAKAYEELGLDFNLEYVIRYIKKESEDVSEYAEYDIFAISKNLIIERFKSKFEIVKHIDYLTITPFLMEPLYELEILERDRIDCFSYLGESDSFLALYRDGEFIYFKSMDFSLEELFKKFSFIHPNVINIEEFLTILENDDQKYQDGLNSIFEEISNYISDILLYIKRIYSMEVQRIYIDSTIKLNDIFYRYLSSFIDIEPQRFNFEYKFMGESVSKLEELAILSGKQYAKDSDRKFNFTVFEREKPFFYKDSGKLLLSTISSLLLSLTYPIYNYSYGLYINYQSSLLDDELKRLSAISSEYREFLKALKIRENQSRERLKLKNSELESLNTLLKDIYNKKLKYSLKSSAIADIVNIIGRYDFQIDRFEITKDNNITLNAISKRESEITKFIKDANSRYSINTERVELNLENNLYSAKINLKERVE